MRQRIFLIIFFGYLAGSVILTVFFPGPDISLRENRPLEHFPQLRAEDILSGTFQDQWEKALSDRLFGLSDLKYGYNLWKQKSLGWSLSLLSAVAGESDAEQGEFQATYLPRGENVFEVKQSGNLVVFVYEPEQSLPVFQEKIRKLESAASLCRKQEPNLSFFLYYIESNRDIDFRNRRFPHPYRDFLKEEFARIGRADFFSVDTWSDFTEQFYRTDHHWNHIGQSKAYQDIVKLLLGEEEKPQSLAPIRIRDIRFVGSRARQIGDFSDGDDFYVNVADLAPHDTYVNGQRSAYGRIEDYLDGTADQSVEVSHYAECFGSDKGLIHYDFHAPERKNLLVIADSYSNPINPLIASHFNRSYFVDLRHYTADMGEAFDLCRFVKEYEIQDVLIMGSAGMILSEEFRIQEDSDNRIEGR